MGLFKNIANAVKDVADVVNDVATPVVDAVTGGLGSKQQDFIDGIFNKVFGTDAPVSSKSYTYEQALHIVARQRYKSLGGTFSKNIIGTSPTDKTLYNQSVEWAKTSTDGQEAINALMNKSADTSTDTSKGGVIGSIVDKGNKWLDNTIGKFTGTLSKNGEHVLSNSLDGYFKKNWAKILAFIAGIGLVIGLAIKAVGGVKKGSSKLW